MSIGQQCCSCRWYCSYRVFLLLAILLDSTNRFSIDKNYYWIALHVYEEQIVGNCYFQWAKYLLFYKLYKWCEYTNFEFYIKIFDRASLRVLPVMDMTENIFPCEQTIHSYIFISIQWNLDLSIHVIQFNSSKFDTPCQTFQSNFE